MESPQSSDPETSTHNAKEGDIISSGVCLHEQSWLVMLPWSRATAYQEAIIVCPGPKASPDCGDVQVTASGASEVVAEEAEERTSERTRTTV